MLRKDFHFIFLLHIESYYYIINYKLVIKAFNKYFVKKLVQYFSCNTIDYYILVFTENYRTNIMKNYTM
jgi:hypothetical protein